MMEAFSKSRHLRIRQTVRRTLKSAGIRFSAIGADRLAIEIDLGRFPQS